MECACYYKITAYRKLRGDRYFCGEKGDARTWRRSKSYIPAEPVNEKMRNAIVNVQREVTIVRLFSFLSATKSFTDCNTHQFSGLGSNWNKKCSKKDLLGYEHTFVESIFLPPRLFSFLSAMRFGFLQMGVPTRLCPTEAGKAEVIGSIRECRPLERQNKVGGGQAPNRNP